MPDCALTANPKKKQPAPEYPLNLLILNPLMNSKLFHRLGYLFLLVVSKSKYFLVTFGVLALDQISKYITKNNMRLSQSEEVLGDFLRYTYIENPGMAFGIDIGNKNLFTVFSIVASLVIFFYLLRTRGDKKYVKFALALILGGAIGNLMDRIRFGAVVDFIDVGIGQLRWPVFNVADSAVSVGMIILMGIILFEPKKHREVEEASQPDSS